MDLDDYDRSRFLAICISKKINLSKMLSIFFLWGGEMAKSFIEVARTLLGRV